MILPGRYRIQRQETEGNQYSNKYKEVAYFKQIDKRSNQYCIKATYRDTDDKCPTCEIFRVYKRSKMRFSHQLEFRQFQETYLVIVENEKSYSCDPERNITIGDKIDENQLKIKYLKEINDDIQSLRVDFRSEETTELLDSLPDSLVTNGLHKVDINILDRSSRDKLFKFSGNYKRNLRREREPGDILKQIVIDVNYARIIPKSKRVQVSKAMELLQQAVKNIEEIKQDDIVLFMGNTGSGKSTAISYFLGADLEYFSN